MENDQQRPSHGSQHEQSLREIANPLLDNMIHHRLNLALVQIGFISLLSRDTQ